MKKIILFLVLVFTVLKVNAQIAIDSLIHIKNDLENAVSLDENRYSETVNSLIFCYINQSDYYRAKQIAEDGINKLKNYGIVNDQPLRMLYCYSGLIEYYLKNYNNAMELFIQVEQMCYEAQSFGDEYIIVMCNAANVLGELQRYADMKNAMDAVISTYEKIYGSIFEIKDEKHFLLLNSYGLANYYNKNFSLAEKCFKYIIANCKGTFESNNALALAYSNYSVLLVNKGRLNDAISMLKNAKTLNTDFIYYIAQNIAVSYFAKWKTSKTAEAVNFYNEVAIYNVSKIFADFPKTERENYWTKISMEVLPFNNMVAYFHNNPEGLKQAFDMTLFCKNLLLNSDKIITEYINKSSDKELKGLYSDLIELKHEFLFQISDKQKQESYRTEIEKLEDIILHKINDLHSLLYNSSKTWDDVRNSLSDGEYAIEYGQMFAPKNDGGTDTTYCALIVGKNFSAPKITFSLSINVFDSIYFSDKTDQLYYTEFYNNKTFALYKLLFSEIEKLIPNARTIYYSPLWKTLATEF